MKVLSVVGARPNFMKIAPLDAEFDNLGVEHILVHTGQHYDKNLSDVFFADLDLRRPDIHLGVGSGSHAEQTARIMLALEPVLKIQKPDVLLVVGDVNSTVASALVAVKMGIKVAHVEAGLRSFDKTMPEEINRLITDQISDYLFTPSPDADDNLRREGIPDEKIFRVGNIMIDSLIKNIQKAIQSDILNRLSLMPTDYAVLTLHRASNVDEPDTLKRILSAIVEISLQIPIVFPIHPRTQARIEQFGLQDMLESAENIIVTEPIGYIDFSALIMKSKFVLTDSGGIQEETTYHGIPCLTLRENTERPITVTEGSNEIVGTNPNKIITKAEQILAGRFKKGKIPEMWDGKTAHRIAELLLQAEG